MTPVHHTGDDELIDVTQNFAERFTLFGWLRRKDGENRAWLVVRRDAQLFYIFAKIRNPVRQLVQLFAELLRWSITKRLWIFHHLSSRRPVGAADLDMINISVPRFPQGSGYS